MNDLAYNSFFCNQYNVGVFGHPSLYMNNNYQQFFSNDFDRPSGYLQDVFFPTYRFHDTSKKRRLDFFSENQSYSDDNSIFEWDLYETLNHSTETNVLDESRNNAREETRILGETKKREDERLAFDDEDTSFSSQADSYNKENSGDSANSVVSMLHSGEQTSQNKKTFKRSSRKVCPFSVVKPGGINEGEVTLNEINERLSKPLVRRVKHPVGEYASKPSVMYLNGGGLGLSGKAVVSLTRIHTLGRGTITIIRTKG